MSFNLQLQDLLKRRKLRHFRVWRLNAKTNCDGDGMFRYGACHGSHWIWEVPLPEFAEAKLRQGGTWTSIL